MFKKTDKRRLFWLIDAYLLDEMDSWSFCSEYHNCYGLESNAYTLTEAEDDVFSKLGTVVGRFSPYKSDHENCPGAFYTEEELRQTALEVKNTLRHSWLRYHMRKVEMQDNATDRV